MLSYWFIFSITKSISEINIVIVIFNFFKYSIQKSVVAAFIILIIQFCNLKILLLQEEFPPPTIIPYFMTEWKYA